MYGLSEYVANGEDAVCCAVYPAGGDDKGGARPHGIGRKGRRKASGVDGQDDDTLNAPWYPAS